MAPVYDTDLGSGRWEAEEWRNTELWEEVERARRRKRRMAVLGAFGLFFALSAVPVVMDARARWATLAAAGRIARELGRVKTLAATRHASFRIRFAGGDAPDFAVEREQGCGHGPVEIVDRGSLGSPGNGLRIVSPEAGSALGVDGLVLSVCYDPVDGIRDSLGRRESIGIAIAPAEDLAAGRLDRASAVLLRGVAAEVSFD